MSGVSFNMAARALPRNLFWAAFVAAFFIYALTLARDVGFYESGEYITACWLKGLPHSPGNPVYVWLCWLFSHALPFGSPAVRVTLFSAFSGALAAGFVALAAHALLSEPRGGEPSGLRAWGAPLATGLIYAFSYSAWSVAGRAGPEAFQGLMASLLILALIRIAARSGWLASSASAEPFVPRADLALAGLSLGLALTGHRSAFFLIPTLLMFFWLVRGRIALPLLSMLKTLGWALLGWLTWLTVIPLSATAQGLNLGYPHDPGRLWEFFTGGDWFQVFFAPSGPSGWAWEAWPQSTLAAALNPLLEFTIPLAFLLLAGLALAIRSNRRAAVLPLALIMFSGIAVVLVADPLAEGALLHTRLSPALIGLTLLIGIAVDALVGAVERLSRGATPRGWESALLIGGACLIPVLAILLPHWSACDRSHDSVAAEYGRNVLNAVPESGILIVSGQQATASIHTYLQRVEGLRLDVDVIDQRATWQPWYMERFDTLHPDVALLNPRTADADPESSLIEGRVYHDNPVIDDLLLENLKPSGQGGRAVCFDPWRLDLRADVRVLPGFADRVFPAGGSSGMDLEQLGKRFLTGRFNGLELKPALPHDPALNVADQYLITCRRIADAFFLSGQTETAVDLLSGGIKRFEHAPRLAYARLSLAGYLVTLGENDKAKSELKLALRETGSRRPLIRGKLLTRLAELTLIDGGAARAADLLDQADAVLKTAESDARDRHRPGDWYDTLDYRIRVLELRGDLGGEDAPATAERLARIEAMRDKQKDLLRQVKPLRYVPPA